MSTRILCYILVTTEIKHFHFFLEIGGECRGDERVRTVSEEQV